MPSNLPLRLCTRLSNVFPVTLGPHGSQLRDFIEPLSVAGRALDKGIILEVGPNREKRFVAFFAMGYFGDMPQQQGGAGFLRQNATYGCRCCVIPKDAKANLEYDILSNG